MSQLRSRIFTPPAEDRPREFATVPPAWRAEPRQNAMGGIAASIVTLTMSMGLGALAFAPFGQAYVAKGVLAGLYSAAFLGLIAIVMGARGAAIYAPRSLVAFVVAAVSADLFLDARWVQDAGPDAVVSAIFLLMALAGAIQLAFGLAGMSRMVKYIPTPVMAGFQNAAAITIMLSQVPVLLGVGGRASWSSMPGHALPLNLAIGIATLLLLFHGQRLVKRVPPIVLGLAVGTLLYYACVAAGFSAEVGPTIGAIPARIPDGRELAGIMALAATPGFMDALPAIAVGALSIALVTSLDVLISAKIVENLTRRRGNSTQELLSIGMGNAITPLLGGIAGSISLAATTTSMKAGGKNSLALFVHALLFLVLVPPLAPLLGYIPRVVIAALLFQAGMNLFDRWTLDLVRRLATRKAIHWPSITIDLGVIVLVASVALAGQIVPAVLIGVAIAVMVFTLRMSRNVIRREQYGDVTQSRRARGAEDLTVLAEHGRSILALELEGPMFFASAELLHNRIDTALTEGVRYVILDFGRVTELDSTGARILLQAHERLRAAKCALVLCGADAHPELAALLVSHRVAEAITHERMFADRDRALEWCENDLLASQREDAALEAGEFSMERIDIFRDLDPVHRESLRGSLERREYRPGDTIFEQGEEGDALYVIARGSATVCVAAPGAPERRLMTFSQGTFFGEMALLDRERRSATLKADDTLICYVLQRDSFERFAAAHPQAALAVVANIGREISLRMRRANRALLELS